MSLDITVAGLMRSKPNIFRSRALALLWLFSSPFVRWVDGELVPEGGEWSPGASSLPHSDRDLANAKHDLDSGNAARLSPSLAARQLSLYLAMLRENHEAAFTIENAEFLAKDEFSQFPTDYTVNFNGLHFDDMPADVKVEWVDAADELAIAILGHAYFPSRAYSLGELRIREETMAKSRVCASAFLNRPKQRPTEPVAPANPQ